MKNTTYKTIKSFFMNVFTKSKSHDRNGINTGLFVLYLVTVAVAATVIIPNEEKIILGVLKSFIWPLYLITKVLK